MFENKPPYELSRSLVAKISLFFPSWVRLWTVYAYTPQEAEYEKCALS